MRSAFLETVVQTRSARRTAGLGYRKLGDTERYFRTDSPDLEDLGNKKAMFLRNHGLLVGGATIREAFDLHYYLERACQAQVTLQSCGVEYITPDSAVAEETARGFERPNREANTRDWPALLAMLDRADPSYAM